MCLLLISPVYFERSVEFIPEYLQLDTQQKLRNAIKKGLSSRHKKPGYVYALDVSGKLVLKIGFSENVKERHKQWQTKHPLSIKDVRGWWPKTIIEVKDDDKTLIQTLIDSNDQGAFVTHVAYLHPDFPKVLYSDLK
ncbi:hypothetical protein F4604DRAFT_1739254 [Suillus subluteus]|nr:hypothetical protein F4604DRAFT_1739254 [Suillus subluteus]